MLTLAVIPLIPLGLALAAIAAGVGVGYGAREAGKGTADAQRKLAEASGFAIVAGTASALYLYFKHRRQ